MCSRKHEELSSSSLSLRLSDDPLPRTKSSVWPLPIHIMRSIHQKTVKRFCRRMHAHKNLHYSSGAIYRQASTACGPSGSAIFNYHAASAGTGTIPIGRAGIPCNLIGIEAPADSAIRALQVLLRSKPLHSQLLDPRQSSWFSISLASCPAFPYTNLSPNPYDRRRVVGLRGPRALERMFSPLTHTIIPFLLLPVPSKITPLFSFFSFSKYCVKVGNISARLQHCVQI